MGSVTTWTPGSVPCGQMFDAEHCPNPIPPGYSSCLVYAGGSSAAHAWLDREIARAAAAGLALLPVWVPTPGLDQPAAAAAGFVSWLTAHKVPHGAPILWDIERGNVTDPAWYKAAADITAKAGYLNLCYGSLNVVFDHAARSGYFVADPTGTPHLVSHDHVKATQWRFNVPTPGGPIDQSLIARYLEAQLWVPITAPKAAPADTSGN